MELNLKKFNKQQLEEYYGFLDLIIERFGLQEGDERFVFNVNKEGQIVFTIGQRYIWNIEPCENARQFLKNQ